MMYQCIYHVIFDINNYKNIFININKIFININKIFIMIMLPLLKIPEKNSTIDKSDEKTENKCPKLISKLVAKDRKLENPENIETDETNENENK